jgi:hypothetical protein
MELVFDVDARAVFEFMLANVPAAKLVAVANAVAQIAPVLWGHYKSEEVRALTWEWSSISACDPRTRSTASESLLVGASVHGGSVAVTDGLE